MNTRAQQQFKELESRFRKHDIAKERYGYSIAYEQYNGYKYEHDIYKLKSGAEGFVKDIEYHIQEYNPDVVEVQEYTGRSNTSKKVGLPVRIMINDTPASSQLVDEMIPKNLSKEQFSGFGGVEGYFKTREEIANKNFQINVLEHDKGVLNQKIQELNDKVGKLEVSNKELEGLNKDLLGKNDELSGAVLELQKYVPGNTKIFGLDPIHLGAAVADRLVRNYIKNNPKTFQSVLGLSDEQLTGFLNGGEETAEPKQKTIETTSVEIVPVQELTKEQQAHLEVATGIFDWMKQITSGVLNKVFHLFKYFHEDTKKLDSIIEFINSKSEGNGEVHNEN